MYTALKNHFKKHISVSEDQLDAFCQFFEVKSLKKKDYWLSEGDICKSEAFVTSGLFKVFHIDVNGNEQVLYFGIEDWWLTDLDSFENQIPSKLYIQALEDSEVLIISKKNKELAFDKFPFSERIFRVMSQKAIVALQRRMIDNLSKTADERYKDFIQRYPKIAQRLTNVQIAAYLGVSHEFVSKIRRKIFQK